MHIILGVESSCDETGVSLIRGNHESCEILSSEIASQIKLHREFGGVVPELASRNHGMHIQSTLAKAVKNADLNIKQIDAVCATAGPGLASSLLVGHTTAKALAVAAKKPFISINHMEGHLLSPFLEKSCGIRENISLVVSGGHTMILHCKGFNQYELLGKTKDDAAGEAFDKVAKMLGLNYPGGPEIEKHATKGNPSAFSFPRSMRSNGLDFSFSGLKTAVLYTLSDLNPDRGTAPIEKIPDLCASFQEAVIDVLVHKTIKAAKERKVPLITLSGGVACNTALRNRMQSKASSIGVDFIPCHPNLSADNAAMIAYVGLHKHLAKAYSNMNCDIDPNFPLNTIQLRK